MKKLLFFSIFASLFALPFQVLAEDFNLALLPREITLSADKKTDIVSVEEFSGWIIETPNLTSRKSGRAEIENIYYCPAAPLICRLTNLWQARMRIQKISEIKINKEKIASYVRDFAGEINKDPVNANFSFENGTVTSFSPSETGIRVDVEKSVEKIADALKEKSAGKISVELVLEKLDPAVTAENINNLGIKELLAEGRSNFRGSPQNRIKNINVGAQKFNGVLIKPGEEFSFVTVLGPVDGEHGYYPELVIKQDKTEPEFGGGICQVSTTAFRAAVLSGLKITARRNHAYPVKYYNPQGMDATVYIPKPDLKFINNTPGNILIQTKIVGTELIFQFYGTSDGRKVEIDGPHITERNPDGSMKAYFVQKVSAADGSVLINDTFKSAYQSPSKFPHPGEEKFTSKPKSWSKAQWKAYKKANGL